jgi:predicted HicB family RNase H-like nuclease
MKQSEAMINTMEIDGNKAIITHVPETDLFRGEWIGLNGGADFYAATVAGLRKEGIEPHNHYSGRFNLRIPPESPAEITAKVAAEGKRLNPHVTDLLGQAVGRQR